MDEVDVQLIGGIIPQVISVNSLKRKFGATPLEFPLRCPSCNQRLLEEIRVDPSTKEEYVELTRCNNLLCPYQKVASLARLASKQGLNISSLEPRVIKILVEKGYISNPSDLLRLKTDSPGLQNQLSAASYNTILKSIEKTKREGVLLENFIYAVGLLVVGLSMSKKLSSLLNKFFCFLNFNCFCYRF